MGMGRGYVEEGLEEEVFVCGEKVSIPLLTTSKEAEEKS